MPYQQAQLERLRDRLMAGAVTVTYRRGANTWAMPALRGATKTTTEETAGALRSLTTTAWVLRAADLAAAGLTPAPGDRLVDGAGQTWELVTPPGGQCAEEADPAGAMLRVHTLKRGPIT